LPPRTPESAIDGEPAPARPALPDEGVIRSGKLAGKTMWSAIAIVAMPILLQQTLAACVGLVDKLLAGNLPAATVKPALDGLGIGTFVGWFIMIAMTGLGVGAQAIIARAMGSGDRRESHTALGQSMMLAFVWGIAVGVLMWISARPLAALASLSPEATHWCVVYVRTIAVVMPFCGVMTVGAMALHGAGEATKPFLIAVLVNIVNTVVSWLASGVNISVHGHVIENPSGLDPAVWGVFGISLGTAASYCVGALATIWILTRGVKDLRLERAGMRLDWHMTRRIVRVGVPNFFEGLVMWTVQLGVMLFIGMADRLHGGEGGVIGAHMITVQWEAFSFLPGFAMGTAAGAVAGQYLGARNPRLARRTIWACTFVGMAIMVSVGVVFMTAGTFLTSMISSEPVHLDLVPKTLFICGIVQVFFALAMVVRNGLRGVGDTVWLLAITVFSCCLIRLPLAYVFGVVLDMGLPGIWIALSIELSIRGLLFLARFVWGGWDRLKV